MSFEFDALVCKDIKYFNHFSPSVTEILEDTHILKLSEEVTGEFDFHVLGNSLRISNNTRATILYNKRNDITLATHELLQKWVKGNVVTCSIVFQNVMSRQFLSYFKSVRPDFFICWITLHEQKIFRLAIGKLKQ